MATLNANYGGFDAANAWAQNAAFAVEKSLRKQWVLATMQAHPIFMALNEGRGNINTGFGIQGRAMTIPVILEDATLDGGSNKAFAGVTDANELSDIGNNSTNGFTQAEFPFSHYRGVVTFRESERVLLANGARGNVLEGKTKQFIETMKSVLSEHLGSDTAGARDRVMGVQFPLNVNVTVGGINQAGTGNEVWQSRRTTSVGQLTLQHIDDLIDHTAKYGGSPDFAFASNAGGTDPNVTGIIRNLLAPGDRLDRNDLKAKYGFRSFVYSGITVVQDHNMTVSSNTGRLAVIDTSSWYAMIPGSPTAQNELRLKGSDAYEKVYTYWCALGIGMPRHNGLFTGITS